MVLYFLLGAFDQWHFVSVWICQSLEIYVVRLLQLGPGLAIPFLPCFTPVVIYFSIGVLYIGNVVKLVQRLDVAFSGNNGLVGTWPSILLADVAINLAEEAIQAVGFKLILQRDVIVLHTLVHVVRHLRNGQFEAQLLLHMEPLALMRHYLHAQLFRRTLIYFFH